MEWTHRIYARHKIHNSAKQRRFYAMDVKNGNLVGNLIYASCFDKNNGQIVLEELTKDFPDWEFQLRKI